MDKVGQPPPDGESYWNGQQWVSRLSPDGNWRWNGQVWEAVKPPDHVVPAVRSRGFLRQIPGFRSGTPWKVAVALVGYLFIALFIASGFAPASRGGIAIGLGALAVVVLATNGWGLRRRLPMFRSPNKWLAAVAWVGLVLIILVAVGATQPAAPTGGNQVAKLSAASSPTPMQSPLATTSPSPTLADSPTPSPSPRPSPIASPKPTPKPAPKPAPKPTTCGAPANPFGYDFCLPATLIYSPPANFCGYFNCIPSFWNSTKGYVDECVDGTYSHSGGRQGACSYHGGERRPLYS